ncbi:glycosyl transferase family 1 [Candidatus Caldarchaeum subterraneum]|uniref:Glycosyl transferase family 1 n=1 Tax=Caldiarchaeum subterraneum TaxID=311458 RepID=E6N4S2_CALS0|nr:glycosyl transferase family 1 [Candidatus Caldarchaeum subterraneum]BAJ50127.1 glycosyl transferase family 1 [Candidatus Caldarchaeum subterraneum]
MRVLMVGRKPSIALNELRRYWGTVDVATGLHAPRFTRYDLVIAQEPTIKIGLPALLQAKLSNAALITEVHGDYLRGNFLPWKDRLFAWLVLRSSDFVRAVNSGIAWNLQSRGLSNVHVVPAVYIRLDIFKPLKNPDERGHVVVTAARLVPEKGLDLLLRAVPLLLQDFPDLEVRILGEGPMRKSLQGLAGELGVGDVVKFLGWAPVDDLVKHYNEAAVFVCTSHYEGGPRTVFEAASCLTPSVSTPVGIVPEVLRDGESVLLVERRDPDLLAEKIAQLLHDRDKRRRLAEKAREIVLREFEWSKSVERYARAYLALASPRP